LKRNKIAYILVEETLEPELLRRQVVELLGDIKSQNPTYYIKVFLLKNCISILFNLKNIRTSKLLLKKQGIKFCIIPTLSPWPFPIPLFQIKGGIKLIHNWDELTIKTFTILSLPFLFIRLYFGRYKILHCRSYPATFLAIKIRKITKSFNVIFDPRSDWPEENVTSGMFNDKEFQFWKKTEIEMLKISNYTACISRTYLRHFENGTLNISNFIVPNNVKTKKFHFSESERKKIRLEYKINDNEIVFVYLGSLGYTGWHNIMLYKRFYNICCESISQFKFLFLTPENCVGVIKSEFKNYDNVIIHSPSFENVPNLLSAADVGMMFFDKKKIAVGTKIGEYLSIGLPFIVNSNCIGASDYIDLNEKLGLLVDIGAGELDRIANFDNIESKITDLLTNNFTRVDFAKKHFDNKVIAKEYSDVYEKIFKLS
jgi:hypothetical protein